MAWWSVERANLARRGLAGSAVFCVILVAGCEPGCGARRQAQDFVAHWGSLWADRAAVVGAGAVDCPDGLARCEDGAVTVSRLAVRPSPCRASSAQCVCPWERIGRCREACVAEGLEVVIEPERALIQLCAPPLSADPFVRAPSGKRESSANLAPPCEEGQGYGCADGTVVDCASGTVEGRCLAGCFAATAAIDRVANREQAFAVLCSR